MTEHNTDSLRDNWTEHLYNDENGETSRRPSSFKEDGLKRV